LYVKNRTSYFTVSYRLLDYVEQQRSRLCSVIASSNSHPNFDANPNPAANPNTNPNPNPDPSSPDGSTLSNVETAVLTNVRGRPVRRSVVQADGDMCAGRAPEASLPMW